MVKVNVPIPEHARAFETLSNDRLAGGFGDSTSNGKVPGSAGRVIHGAAMVQQVTIGLLVVFQRFSRQGFRFQGGGTQDAVDGILRR